jgi:hypothetical protein
MKLSLDRQRIDSLPREIVLDELRRVAEHYGGRHFSRHEFDRIASLCKGTTVLKHFGTWANALANLGVPLQPHRPDRKQITTADLLRELARVWRTLGHRPSKSEWDVSDAVYSYSTYKQRFGGWVSACVALVEAQNDQETVTEGPLPIGDDSNPVSMSQTHPRVPPEKNRTIPLKLRLKILSRDNFKCRVCGRTPALNPEVVLHIDHIVPFSKGGETVAGNLQTLCDQCNRGKGNDESIV